MLNENIKKYRKAKGLSQEELAERLNVVRQTVSKWENGLSVPDSQSLIRIGCVLDIPVSKLLGEPEQKVDHDESVAEKLEALNRYYADRQEEKRKLFRIFSVVIAVIATLFLMQRIWFLWVVLRPMFSAGILPDSVNNFPYGNFTFSVITIFLRTFLIPVAALILATIGIYKTKKQ